MNIKNKPFAIIEEMYNENYSYLRNYLIGLTRSHEEADDVIQELFSKILRNPHWVLEVAHTRGWLVKSARNTLLDLHKKKRPELLQDEKIIENLLISNHSLEEEIVLKNQLETYFAEMSTTDKAIFIAKEYYGYKYEEISELLDIPISTVKSRVFRMRKKMMKERGD